MVKNDENQDSVLSFWFTLPILALNAEVCPLIIYTGYHESKTQIGDSDGIQNVIQTVGNDEI